MISETCLLSPTQCSSLPSISTWSNSLRTSQISGTCLSQSLCSQPEHTQPHNAQGHIHAHTTGTCVLANVLTCRFQIISILPLHQHAHYESCRCIHTPSPPKLPPPVVLFDYVGEEDQGKGEERIKS